MQKNEGAAAQARYETVAEELRERIRSGGYAPDEKIPSERELAADFGVNRITVSKALSALVSEGLLVRKVGSGSYVSSSEEGAGTGQLRMVNVCLPLPPRLERSGGGRISTSSLLEGPGVAETVYDYFRAQATKVAVSFYRDEREQAALLFQFAKERNAAHIIWYQPGESARAGVMRLLAAGQIFCLIDSFEPELRTNFAGLNNNVGGALMAGELIRSGHKDIMYLTLPPQQSSLAQRMDGFSEMAAGGGARVHTFIWEEDGSPAESAARLPTELMRIVREKGITAIAACKDQLALRALAILQERNVRVPDEVSLIGFDGLAATAYTRPALSTVAQPFDQIGMLAANLIDRQWLERTLEPQTQLVVPTIVRRASVRYL